MIMFYPSLKYVFSLRRENGLTKIGRCRNKVHNTYFQGWSSENTSVTRDSSTCWSAPCRRGINLTKPTAVSVVEMTVVVQRLTESWHCRWSVGFSASVASLSNSWSIRFCSEVRMYLIFFILNWLVRCVWLRFVFYRSDHFLTGGRVKVRRRSKFIHESLISRMYGT